MFKNNMLCSLSNLSHKTRSYEVGSRLDIAKHIHTKRSAGFRCRFQSKTTWRFTNISS